jgi:hypothetical protein
MLIGSFKAYTPSAIIKLPLFAVFLWAFCPLYRQAGLHSGHLISIHLYGPVGNFSIHNFFLSCFISLIINVISAFLLNYIVNHNNLIARKTYLPALFFLIYNAFCGELLCLSAGSLANFLIIVACHQLFNTYRKESALSEVFNSGMLIGISSLIYFPSLILFLFVWITLVIYRPFIWQEYAVSLLGLLLPLVYYVVYNLWFNKLGSVWTETTHTHLAFKPTLFETSNAYIFLYTVFGIIILSALFRVANSTVVLPLKSKKGISLLFWCFLLAAVAALFNPFFDITAFKMTTIGLSVFSANLFIQIKKNWVGEMLFSFILLSILFVHLSAYQGK